MAHSPRPHTPGPMIIFWGTLNDIGSPTPPLNGNAKKWRCAGVCLSISSRGAFARISHISDFGAIMPETLGESTPPSATTGACAQRRKARQTPETDIQQRSRRRARQSREYELICLLQQRLRAVSWPHLRLRCMQPLLSHGMGLVKP